MRVNKIDFANMDWIKGIQRAIDYTEIHLTEEIDYDLVAKEAYSSAFHFQRVFSIMSGYTLGDYIRRRRLSLAAEGRQIVQLQESKTYCTIVLS